MKVAGLERIRGFYRTEMVLLNGWRIFQSRSRLFAMIVLGNTKAVLGFIQKFLPKYMECYAGWTKSTGFASNQISCYCPDVTKPSCVKTKNDQPKYKSFAFKAF